MVKYWVKGEKKYHFIYLEKVILVNVTQRPAESLILSPVMDRFIYLVMWDSGQIAHVGAAPVPCSVKGPKRKREEGTGLLMLSFCFKNHKSRKGG